MWISTRFYAMGLGENEDFVAMTDICEFCDFFRPDSAIEQMGFQVAAVIALFFPFFLVPFPYFFGFWYFHQNMPVYVPHGTCIQYTVYILSRPGR